MPAKLKDLLSSVTVLELAGDADLLITGIKDDSRLVEPGDLFVALAGLHVDGTAFVVEAAARGASAVVSERAVAAEDFSGTRVRVASAPKALALVAARYFGNPSQAMRMVGITGTNGKTTTTFLVESILRAGGFRPGVIGTVNYRYADRVLPAPFTTPTPIPLENVLAEMRAAGTTHVIMETSSHALALDRLEGIAFRVGAFSNLTQDHLDFHGTMEAYFHAKARLLRERLVAGEGVGVVLIDGPYGARMSREVVGERLLVSAKSDDADVYPRSSSCTIDGIRAELASPMGAIHVRSRLVGHFNLENLSLAAGICIALGVDVASIERGIEGLVGVPGRLEPALTAATATEVGFSILVDYAHTHDALENVLAALRPLTRGRIICVFGCGGDRDRTKRPKMGMAAARDADLAIVTSDNPRTEDPRAIVDMILDGVRQIDTPLVDEGALATAPRGAWVEVDRRKAIRAAVGAARPGDVVLLAGKGHEDYQIIGTTKHPFDDREIARQELALRRRDPQS